MDAVTLTAPIRKNSKIKLGKTSFKTIWNVQLYGVSISRIFCALGIIQDKIILKWTLWRWQLLSGRILKLNWGKLVLTSWSRREPEKTKPIRKLSLTAREFLNDYPVYLILSNRTTQKIRHFWVVLSGKTKYPQ